MLALTAALDIAGKHSGVLTSGQACSGSAVASNVPASIRYTMHSMHSTYMHKVSHHGTDLSLILPACMPWVIKASLDRSGLSSCKSGSSSTKNEDAC